MKSCSWLLLPVLLLLLVLVLPLLVLVVQQYSRGASHAWAASTVVSLQHWHASQMQLGRRSGLCSLNGSLLCGQ